MRKIMALTRNEWIKVSRKTSILVILLLMVVAVLGLGGIMRLTLQESQSNPSQQDDAWMKQAMKDNLAQLKAKLDSLNAQLINASDSQRETLEAEKPALLAEIELYSYAIEKGINLMSGENYLADALRARIKANGSLTARYDAIIIRHDFADYIALQNEMVRADAGLSKSEQDIKTGINDLWLRLDPTGEDAEGKTSKGIRQSLNQVESLRRSLLDNLDYSGGSGGVIPMSPQRRGEVSNALAVLVFKLENGRSTPYNPYPSSSTGDMATVGMTGVGMFMVILLMTILAGSAISSEISTGSIKSLIISPARRWKIYLAKLLALAATGVLMGFLLYLVTMLAHGLYFGFGSGAAYVYADNGVAGEMGFFTYQLARLAVSFLDVAVYALMAYMLSIITRNTAVSVGLSIAVYFSSSIIQAFLTLFSGHAWVRFVPFSNMSLADRIFSYDTTSQSIGFLSGAIMPAGSPSVLFSLVYIGALLICMGYVGLDSFNRRDIK